MSVPSLNPRSTVSSVILSSTGSYGDVEAALPFGIYSSDPNFASGAVDQISFVYNMLGRRRA